MSPPQPIHLTTLLFLPPTPWIYVFIFLSPGFSFPPFPATCSIPSLHTRLLEMKKKNWVHIHCEFFGCPSSSLMSHHFSFPYTAHWQVTLAGRLLDSVTLTWKRGSAALCAQTASLGRGIKYLGTLNTPGGGLVTMLCGWKFVDKRLSWKHRLWGLINTWSVGEKS